MDAYNFARRLKTLNGLTDTGWKISLDRGLDIFQHFLAGDAFNLANRFQEHRAVKQFEVTYLRV